MRMSSIIIKRAIANDLNRRILRSTFLSKKFSSESSDFILKSIYPDVEIPRVTLQEFVFKNTDRWPNKIAIECGLTGRRYTYDDIRIKSRNFSRAMRKKLKLTKGDVVAILLPNEPEYPIAVFGILKAGLLVTTMNPLYTADEISKQLIDSNAKAVITLNRLCDTVHEACRKANRSLSIVTIKTNKSESTKAGTIDFESFTNERIDIDDLPPGDPEDVVVLPYSSGTTGLPKGVELRHRNIVSNLQVFSTPEYTLFEETTETHQDIAPAVLPMFHIYGFTTITMCMLSCGCKVVTLPKFTPNDYTSVIKNHKPNILFTVPPIVLFLTHHAALKKEDFEPIRAVLSGAAPLGASDEQKFLEKVQKPIHMIQGYGLTETSPVVAMVTFDIKKRFNCYGSIGSVLPNTLAKVVAVDDPSGTPLGPNQSGELLVKGPQVMKGYLNKLKETAETFADGWMKTGDMVYYNEDKLIYVTDRLKELIKVKAFQVPPAELEQIIRSYPNVADAAVIGIPHPEHGEVPRAYVVSKNNTDINEEELREFVAGKVAHYKQLRGGISIVESIPKNAAGKILRRELKQRYEKTKM